MRGKKLPSNMIRAAECKLEEFNAIDRDKSIFLLPVSSQEAHGYHLPGCTDMVTSRLMAELSGRLFAKKYPDWTVVLMPLLNIGSDELPLPGSIEFSRKTVYRALVEYGKSLAKWGFRNVVISNGHGGFKHNLAIDDACRTCNRKFRMKMISPCIRIYQDYITGRKFLQIEAETGQKLSKSERAGLTDLEHAGGWETSIMLAEHPSLVSKDYKKYKSSNVQLSESGKKLAQFIDRIIDRIPIAKNIKKESKISIDEVVRYVKAARKMYNKKKWFPYNGNPSIASSKIGKAWSTLLSGDVLSILEKVFVESVIKPNKIVSRFSLIYFLRRSFYVTFYRIIFGIIVILITLMHLS